MITYFYLRIHTLPHLKYIKLVYSVRSSLPCITIGVRIQQTLNS